MNYFEHVSHVYSSRSALNMFRRGMNTWEIAFEMQTTEARIVGLIEAERTKQMVEMRAERLARSLAT